MNELLNRTNAMLKKMGRAWPAILLAAALAFSWVTAWSVTMNLLDSDTSSELVLANLLARQNRIVTPDWFYSNELRVIQTQLVFAPLFKIFTDWHMVRFVGVMILQLLLVLSYRYFCRRMGLSRRAFLISAAILVMPYSVGYGRVVLYHTFYLPFVAIGFLLVGLYLSVLGQAKSDVSPARRVIRLAALLAVSFLAGLNGVRQLMITMVPLIASAVFVTFRKSALPKTQNSRSYAARSVRLALGVLGFGACGYLVYQHLLVRTYAFHLFNNITLGIIGADNFTYMLQGFFAQFGFQGGRLLFSVGGLLACGGLLIALYLLIMGFRALRTVKQSDDEPADWTALMFATSMATMIAIFFFTRDNANYLQYLIPVAVWAVPLLANRLELSKAVVPGRRWLLYAICALMLANGVYNNLFYISPGSKPVDYEGLSSTETDKVAGLQGALRFLEDNHYTLGYASFWNANVITEISDGSIRMVNIIFDRDNSTAMLYNWLSDKNLRNRDYVAKQKVFILLKGDEDQAFYDMPLSENAEYAYEDENYMIFTYENPTDPLDALLAESSDDGDGSQ